MSRRSYLIVAMGAFVLLLLYTTFRSTSTPLQQPAEERELAQRTCRASVRSRVPDARFPFDANFAPLEDGRLRLSGSVDRGPASQPVRQNYECLLRTDPDAGFIADSTVVWQSH